MRQHYWENDNCMDNKINEKDFLQYYDELVNRSDYFDDIKPSIGRLVRHGDDEVFENCDQWIYNRITKLKNKEITSINKESVYHIMHTYLEWIRTNKLAMFSTPYPGYKLINEISVDCRFKPSIFRYIKGSCNFSVFMSTDNLNFPHIPNYIILGYSTSCDDTKVDYSFNDLEVTAGNLNHISCNNNLRFCLLPTFPFTSSYHQAVKNLIDHMNYILDYEEWPVNFPEEPLQRWGEAAPIARAYHETEVQTKINNNRISLILNDIQKIEQDTNIIIDQILTEHDKKIKLQIESQQIVNQKIPLNPISENIVKTEFDMEWDIVEMLILELKSMLKNKKYNDNHKYIIEIIKGIKQVYDENSGIFETDSILESISRTVIDLTQTNDEDTNELPKASPNSKGKGKKGKKKWIPVQNKK